MGISIITPTYNRCHTLDRLYQSLLSQTSKDFEWIVIDDGSTDSTEQMILQKKAENKIRINYIKTVNGGKHRAVNKGVDVANYELVFIVDSDDWLPNNAIKCIINTYNTQKSNNIIGIIAKRGYVKDNKIMSLTIVNTHSKLTTLYDFYFKYNCKGDTALVYKTEIIKKTRFKEFNNEKFLSENSLFFSLDDYGKMYLKNKILYLNEYQTDGLTANSSDLLVRNPAGTAYMYYIYFKYSKKVLLRLKYLGLLNYYYNLSDANRQVYDLIDNKYLVCKACSLYGKAIGLMKRCK